MSEEERLQRIKDSIGAHPDFPKKGIIFRDIWPMLQRPDVFEDSVALMSSYIKKQCINVDVIVGLESRGFIFGPMIAPKLQAAFVPIRKAGKLPGDTVKVTYKLEYGEDCFEIQKNSIKPGQKVVIVDDLMATGGTMKAASDLVREVKGDVILCVVLIELVDLHGREKVSDPLKAFITFEGD